MMEFFIESFISVFECFITLFFLNEFLGIKFEKRKQFVLFAVFFLVHSVFSIYRDHFISVENENLLSYAYVLYDFIYAYFCLKGSINKKVFASIFTYLINSLIIIIIPSTVSFISGVPIYDMVKNFSPLRVFTLFLTKIALTLLLFLMLYLQNRLTEDFSNFQYGGLSVIMIAGYILEDYMIEHSNFVPSNQFDQVLYISTYVGIIICIILIYYLMIQTNILIAQKAENTILRKQHEYEKQYIDNAISVYNRTKTLKHDLKHHLFSVYMLIDQNQNEDAQKYISSIIDEEINKLVIMIDCGDNALNAVISSKMNVCKEEKIDFKYEICADLKNIPSMDVCNIIANTVDNAIEACRKAKEKKIELYIFKVKNYLSITVKNTIEKSVLKTNPDLQSTKANLSMHGIGTKSVKAVAKKHNGSVEYSEEGKFFICHVLLSIFQ